jgi:hypothetical protein
MVLIEFPLFPIILLKDLLVDSVTVIKAPSTTIPPLVVEISILAGFLFTSKNVKTKLMFHKMVLE